MAGLRRQPDDMRTAHALDRNTFTLDCADVILARIDQRDVVTGEFEQTAIDATHCPCPDHVDSHFFSKFEMKGRNQVAGLINNGFLGQRRKPLAFNSES